MRFLPTSIVRCEIMRVGSFELMAQVKAHPNSLSEWQGTLSLPGSDLAHGLVCVSMRAGALSGDYPGQKPHHCASEFNHHVARWPSENTAFYTPASASSRRITWRSLGIRGSLSVSGGTRRCGPLCLPTGWVESSGSSYCFVPSPFSGSTVNDPPFEHWTPEYVAV